MFVLKLSGIQNLLHSRVEDNISKKLSIDEETLHDLFPPKVKKCYQRRFKT